MEIRKTDLSSLGNPCETMKGRAQEEETIKDDFSSQGAAENKGTYSFKKYEGLFDQKIVCDSLEPKWKIPLHGTMGISKGSPFLTGSDGSLFVSERKDPSEAPSIGKINPETGERIWTKELEPSAEIAFPIALKGKDELLVKTSRRVICLDQSTGKENWAFKTRNSDTQALQGKDGTIFTSRSGDLCALKPDGSKKWKFKTNDDSLQIATIDDDGTAYAVCKEGLYAISPSGKKKWFFKKEKTSAEQWGVSAAAGFVYHVGLSKDENQEMISSELTLIDAATGIRKWRTNIGLNDLYVGYDGNILLRDFQRHTLTCVDPADGAELWKINTGWLGTLQSITPEGTIILECAAGDLTQDCTDIFAIDSKDGHELWRRRVDRTDESFLGVFNKEDKHAIFDDQGRVIINVGKKILGIEPKNGEIFFGYESKDNMIDSFAFDYMKKVLLVAEREKKNLDLVLFGFDYRGIAAKRAMDMQNIPQEDPRASRIITGPGFVQIGGVKLETRKS